MNKFIFLFSILFFSPVSFAIHYDVCSDSFSVGKHSGYMYNFECVPINNNEWIQCTGTSGGSPMNSTCGLSSCPAGEHLYLGVCVTSGGGGGGGGGGGDGTGGAASCINQSFQFAGSYTDIDDPALPQSICDGGKKFDIGFNLGIGTTCAGENSSAIPPSGFSSFPYNYSGTSCTVSSCSADVTCAIGTGGGDGTGVDSVLSCPSGQIPNATLTGCVCRSGSHNGGGVNGGVNCVANSPALPADVNQWDCMNTIAHCEFHSPTMNDQGYATCMSGYHAEGRTCVADSSVAITYPDGSTGTGGGGTGGGGTGGGGTGGGGTGGGGTGGGGTGGGGTGGGGTGGGGTGGGGTGGGGTGGTGTDYSGYLNSIIGLLQGISGQISGLANGLGNGTGVGNGHDYTGVLSSIDSTLKSIKAVFTDSVGDLSSLDSAVADLKTNAGTSVTNAAAKINDDTSYGQPTTAITKITDAFVQTGQCSAMPNNSTWFTTVLEPFCYEWDKSGGGRDIAAWVLSISTIIAILFLWFGASKS